MVIKTLYRRDPSLNSTLEDMLKFNAIPCAVEFIVKNPGPEDQVFNVRIKIEQSN
jgi:hypothetical protein